MSDQYRVLPNETKPTPIPDTDRIPLTDHENKGAKNLNGGVGVLILVVTSVGIGVLSQDFSLALFIAAVVIVAVHFGSGLAASRI